MAGRSGCGRRGEEAAKVLDTSAYFDAVNFARKFKGKSLLCVGFIDTACPPTSVYSAFNMLPEPKTIFAAPRLGHAATRGMGRRKRILEEEPGAEAAGVNSVYEKRRGSRQVPKKRFR